MHISLHLIIKYLQLNVIPSGCMPQGSETVLWVAIFTLKIKQLLTVVIALLE